VWAKPAWNVWWTWDPRLTTYTIVTAMGEALSIYAQGETVEKVRLTTTMNGPTLATLITKSGKEFEVPHAALAMIGS
jgi:ABC-type transport system involved in cytochrome c biogenesis permease subunit